MVVIWLCGLKETNESLYHIIIMHMINVISKRIKESPRDILMEETHMKEKYETKMMNKSLRLKISRVNPPQSSLLRYNVGG